MTTDLPEEPSSPKAPRGERSIDFGAELMKQAKKKVRESARLDAKKVAETPPPTLNPDLADAPRESLVNQSGPVIRPREAQRPRRPLRTRLLAAALVTLASLLVVEVAARVFTREPEAIRGKQLGASAFQDSLRFPVPSERAPAAPYRLDRQIGFGLVSDYDAFVPFEEAPGSRYRLRTNGLGLRDDRPLVPKSGFRIVVVGDSMTFGSGVEREQAFPAVLERTLAGDLGRPLEVVNAGVPCWGQREEVAFIEHRAPDLQPDLVLLELTVANDVLDNARYKDGAADLVPDPHLGEDLEQHPLFELPFAETSRAYRLFAWHVGRHVIRYRAMLEPARLERTRALLRRGRDAATALHARFAVLIAPSSIQADGSPAELLLRTHRINDAILRGCKEDGIPAFDPLEKLRQAKVRGREGYWKKDRHWNVEGHEIVGEAASKWIVGLLGE